MKPTMNPAGAQGEPPRAPLTCPECDGPKPARYALLCTTCHARLADPDAAGAPREGA